MIYYYVTFKNIWGSNVKIYAIKYGENDKYWPFYFAIYCGSEFAFVFRV